MLTLNPDIELQTLDRLHPLGLPFSLQDLYDLGLDHGRPIGNFEGQSALEMMTTTMIGQEEILVVSRSATKTSLMVIEESHTK